MTNETTAAAKKDSPQPEGGKKFSRLKEVCKKSYVGWLFTLPMTLGLLIFTFYPMIQSLVYAFAEYDGVEHFELIGLGNFIRMFTVDRREVFTTLRNTFLYSIISVPLTLVLSYMLALLVNKKIAGVGVFRVLYYLPVVIPSVVSGLLWKGIYDPTYGLGNSILNAFGLPSSQFFEAEESALASYIFMNVFGVGGSMILWLSTLKNVPPELYEAATIDGANGAVKLFCVTIPLSTSMIFYNLITGIIGSLQTFNTYVIAANEGRGPGDSLYFFAVKIYNTAFSGMRFEYGYASALAWVLFIIVGVLTIFIFRTSKWVYYGEES